MGDVEVQVVVLVGVGVVMMMKTITLTQCQQYTAVARRSEWSSIIVEVDPLVVAVMKGGTTRNIMTNVDILPRRRRRRRSIVVVVQATLVVEVDPTHPKMIPLGTFVAARGP